MCSCTWGHACNGGHVHTPAYMSHFPCAQASPHEWLWKVTSVTSHVAACLCGHTCMPVAIRALATSSLVTSATPRNLVSSIFVRDLIASTIMLIFPVRHPVVGHHSHTLSLFLSLASMCSSKVWGQLISLGYDISAKKVLVVITLPQNHLCLPLSILSRQIEQRNQISWINTNKIVFKTL